jgi:acetoin utilization protein AcuB
MKIENIMTKKLITLSMDAPLSKAKETLESYAIHHLLLTDDDGLLAGMITDRDLYKHLSPTVGTSQESHRDTAQLQKKSHQIMARNLITAQAHDPLSKTILLLHDNHISCLPIVDKDNKAIGIITWRDVLKVLALQYRKKQKT